MRALALSRSFAACAGAWVLCISTSVAPAQVTLTNCTEAALRAALAVDSTVIFAVDGVIPLGNTLPISRDTTLDARGRQVTLSGGMVVPVFYVASNATLSLLHLTITKGSATNGGAIYNDSGILKVVDSVFATNAAVNASINADACGGAIFNHLGSIYATNCTFRANVSLPTYGSGWGGAIYNQGGLVKVQQCTFTGNGATGAPWSDVWHVLSNNSRGGAIYNAGTLFASLCTFAQNSATGGKGLQPQGQWPGGVVGGTGGSGGTALGGALCNLGLMAVDSTLFVSNTAVGGMGGTGAGAYAPLADFGWPAGPGGTGGPGYGGALFNSATASLVNCTLAWNSGFGGTGGTGGPPAQSPGGGSEPGGMGGSGGPAVGGVVDTNGLLALTNCTIALCSGTGGAAGIQSGFTGPPGTNGLGFGAALSIGTRLINSLLASNVPGNCSGTLLDLGHNLSSDFTCAFTQTGSHNSTDPKLAPLADNGGATATLALLPGSPAIDAADGSAAPVVDARGFARPFGPAADIGAFEYWPTPPVLQVNRSPAGGVDILVLGPAGQSCRLVASHSLADWLPVATNSIPSNGTLLFHEGATSSNGFYRVVSP